MAADFQRRRPDMLAGWKGGRKMMEAGLCPQGTVVSGGLAKSCSYPW